MSRQGGGHESPANGGKVAPPMNGKKVLKKNTPSSPGSTDMVIMRPRRG